MSEWLITMVNKSAKDRVVGPLPNGRTSWLINGGLLITYKSWDDPRFVVIARLPGMGVYVPLRLGRA